MDCIGITSSLDHGLAGRGKLTHNEAGKFVRDERFNFEHTQKFMHMHAGRHPLWDNETNVEFHPVNVRVCVCVCVCVCGGGGGGGD